MSENSTPLERNSIDTKFILSALLIGASYAAIVVLIERVVGETAAGVAGVTMTGVIVAIFKQFEKLRFKQIVDSEPAWEIAVPRFRASTIVLQIFAFQGAQIFLGMFFGLIFPLLGLRFESFDEFFLYLYSDYYWAVYLLTGAAYLVAAFTYGKAVDRIVYAEVALSALLSQLIVTIVPLTTQVATGLLSWDDVLSVAAPAGIFLLLYVAAALLGLRMGRRKSLKAVI